MIFGVRKFRAYLAGARFIIRMDHSALQWLLDAKEPEGKMARWIQELGTYEFLVIHRPGKKHRNTDRLLRLLCKQCGRTGAEEDGSSGEMGATISWDRESWQNMCQQQRADKCVGSVGRGEADEPLGPPPESLKSSEEGRQVQMYWAEIKVWHGALGWSWAEPDGHRHWVGYPPRWITKP